MRPCARPAQPLGPLHYGDQADLEWAYVVDIRRKGVPVYTGCGTVEGLTAASPQDLEVQLQTLYDEHRPKARRRIRAGGRALVS